MFTINCKGRLLSLEQPIVMGIINATPDSFFEGSRVSNKSDVIDIVQQMVEDGVTIIDVGGQSTRPGSKRINSEEELKRTIPIIERIHSKFPELILSIDTYYAIVAQRAVDAGASIINDVSAGTIDKDLLPVVAALNVPYVLMHLKGDLETMQQNPMYDNVVLEVFDFLNFKIKELHNLGIKDVIVDPGFGFAKNTSHNFKLLNGLSYLQQLNKPILVGLSRKGSIYKTLNTTADKALNGTTVLHTISLLNGASILRVHDVKEAKEAITLIEALSKEKEQP
ncbi:MAG TPA: dihydropteroate synthase [Chitinophagaceae bacterium]|jgi:dihydropteroate synthase|nr:dihydropteroate synthase [Chitinophagaceae bacterium]